MRKKILALVFTAALLVALAVPLFGGGVVSASQPRVAICHFNDDATDGTAPRTISVAAPAVAKHLDNHTDSNGYEGDDFLGPCL